MSEATVQQVLGQNICGMITLLILICEKCSQLHQKLSRKMYAVQQKTVTVLSLELMFCIMWHLSCLACIGHNSDLSKMFMNVLLEYLTILIALLESI